MKKAKVFVGILISLSLVLCTLMPAFAESGSCDCGTAPVIQVRGVGTTLYDEGGNEIFSAENIIAGILPIIPDLASYLVTQDTDTFVSAVDYAVKTIFGPVMYDNDGNRTTTVVVNNSSAPVETYIDFTKEDMGNEEKMAEILYEGIGEEHSYLFVYDWTGDPFEIASELNAYIQEVKTTSGHDKVSLCGESMGGAITNTYLAMYGYDDIQNIVMSNSAFNGLEMMGQLFTGHTDIDGENLAKLISQSIRGSAEYESLLAYLPIFEQLALMADDIIAVAGDRLYNEVLIPVFGYIPGFWTFVPEEHYLDAMDFMLNDAGAAYKLWVATYYATVVGPTDSRVADMVESDEVNYFCVSNYNKYIAPVTPSSQWNSDGVIETYNTSGFAVVADMGETLGDDYVQAVNTGKNMISPDNVIDASTCQAPNMTWFIKNLGHVNYDKNDGTGDFYVWLLSANEQYTIDSNESYPQFMYYDTEIPMLMTFEDAGDSVNKGDGGIGDILGGITGGGNGDDATGEGDQDGSSSDDATSGEVNGNPDISDTFVEYSVVILLVVAIMIASLTSSFIIIKKRREE